MNNLKKYILGFCAALGLGVTLSGCQDNFGNITAEEPVATMQANATIKEVKALFWDDAINYAVKIPAREDGSHYIVKGRVISSDEAGNVFKSLVIQDETAALAFSINSYNLYLNYRRGQEVVVDLTDLYIGKYNGLQQIGMREWYANGNAYEVTFMAPESFTSHTELNGWPDLAKIDTLEINSFSELSTNPDGLQSMQSQLVKLNNVTFQDGGVEKFSEYHENVNRTLVDSEGATMIVRTSGYANFWNQTLPTGYGDVVAILSYYGTSGWQLLLNDYEGCMNFGNPTEKPGSEANPYDVAGAIAEIEGGFTASGWVKGYVAGAVAPDVAEVTSNDDIEWEAPTVLATTLVIAPDMTTRDIKQCLVIALPSDSPLRLAANLRDNPDALGKEIMLKGTFGTYMGTYGILNNSGTNSEFKLDGYTNPEGEPIPNGDGSEASPWNPTQVLAGTASGTSTWVKGYIVGWIPDKSFNEAIFELPASTQTNIVIATKPDVKDYTQCIAVQLPAGVVRNALNLQSNPGVFGKAVSLLGSVEKYFGVMGLKAVSDYVIEGGSTGGDTPGTPDTPDTPPTGGGDGTEASPFTVAQIQAGATGSDVWSEGYIVGYIPDKYFDGAIIGANATVNTNIIIAATASETDINKCVPVQLPQGDVRTALNLQSNPGNLGRKVALRGSLEAYFGQKGIKSVTEYKFDGQGGGTGGDTPGTDTPTTPPATGGDDADFNTFNEGNAIATYNTYTNSTGWTAVNAQILRGQTAGTDNTSTQFTMFGGPEVYAVCLNGRTDKQGILTSSTLTGGCKTLTFNFGHPYSDSKYSFTVNIKQNDSVAFTQTFEGTSDKFAVQTASMEPNVTGDFVIEIINNGPSQSSSGNKDRVAFWNLVWTK